MSTQIEWTDDTWNPVTGCTKVSAGCKNCYAETVAGRFWPQQYVHTVERGFIPVGDYKGERMDGKLRQFTDVMTHADRLDQPLHWRKPRRIFVNSMSDLFHEDVPDAFIDRVFAVMALASQHTFQILTKRAERMRKYFDGIAIRQELIGIEAERISGFDRYDVSGIGARWTLPLPNVWLGVSVENQRFADERIPLLLQTPAAVRFLSCEPLLGHLNIIQFLSEKYVSVGGRQWIGAGGIQWCIFGGESGPGARPMDLEWVRDGIRQCRKAGAAPFVKQLGAQPWVKTAHHYGPGVDAHPYNVRYQLKNRKGGDPSEWPEDLRVRQFPEARA